MTLDEAIRNLEENAIVFEAKAICADGSLEQSYYERTATEHRMLIEWLTELKERRATDVQPVNMFMSDRCIVCYHDVRKDTAYYDINGATVCKACIGVQCKVNNPIKEQED